VEFCAVDHARTQALLFLKKKKQKNFDLLGDLARARLHANRCRWRVLVVRASIRWQDGLDAPKATPVRFRKSFLLPRAGRPFFKKEAFASLSKTLLANYPATIALRPR
jgi:hypothetical protein